MSVGNPINLLTLAKSNEQGLAISGTNLELRLLTKSYPLTSLKKDLWLLILKGELIIDLPHGDFRILKEGDSLHLSEGLQVKFQAVKETVLLQQNL